MSNEAKLAILFVGLGAMGRPMAERLADVGNLTVSDLDLEAARAVAETIGARVTDNPAKSAEEADFIVLSLPNSFVVENVLISDGVLNAMRPGSVIVDLSSSLPSSTITLAEQASKRGVGFVDAPVSGGVAKAKTGQLSIMAGADTESSFERASVLFDVLGVSVTRTGPVGTGHAMKALNNMLSAIGLLGASEVLAAATKFGIEPATAIDVLNNSTGRNHATEVKFKPFVLSGTYNAGFAMELMVKDIGMALDLAEVEGTPHALMASAVDSIRMIYEDLKAADPSMRRDHTEVARWVSDTAGVSFSSSDRRIG